MSLALVSFILLVKLLFTFSFNLDTEFSATITSKSENDYFGYSVLLQKGNPSTVITGAIRSNSSYNKEIISPGVIHNCPLNDKNKCEEYAIYDRNVYEQFVDSNFNYKKINDGKLLGATIAGGENKGDPITICAPKWKIAFNGFYLPNGKCYHIENSSKLGEIEEEIRPLTLIRKISYNGIYRYALGVSGISLTYIKNNSEILIGAPGVENFAGTVIRHQIKPFESNQRNEDNVPNPNRITNLKYGEYFGYSTAYGKFMDGENYWYISGAPRSNDLKGRVFMFSYSNYFKQNTIVHREFTGDQIGAYFGYSLLAYQKNQNSVNDLIVGAPTYSFKEFDEGCVYYFQNDGKGNFLQPVKIFGDVKSGSRFGLAFSSLGDLNRDSFDDVAISAPYEQGGRGAIYIFFGGLNGLADKYSQKITAESFPKQLYSLGFSLSKGVDIDQNDYNDLAIGAYKSGKVLILRAKPVIKYHPTLRSSLSEFSIGIVEEFNVTFCLSFTTYGDVIKSIETIIKYSKTFQIGENYNETIILKSDFEYCKVYNLTTTSVIDFLEPILLTVEFNLKNQSLSKFCKLCPMTDPKDSNLVSLEIPFANGCKNQKNCQPDLLVQANFHSKSFYKVGEDSVLKMDIFVINYGEPAFLTELLLIIPDRVYLAKMPNKCTLKDNILNCFLKNVLLNNEKKSAELEFHLNKITQSDNLLNFSIEVNSRGNDTDRADNKINLKLPVKRESVLETNGDSTPEHFVYRDESKGFFLKEVNISHVYSFINLGPTPLSSLYFEIRIPEKYENDSFISVNNPMSMIEEYDIECETLEKNESFENNEKFDENIFKNERNRRNTKYVEEKSDSNDSNSNFYKNVFSINCSDNSLFDCKKIRCKSGQEMKKNQIAKIKLQFVINLEKLEKLSLRNNFIVFHTEILTNYTQELKSYRAKTLLIGYFNKYSQISYWIYIVGVVAGILLLSGITYVLYKFKFFNRPLREKLLNNSENNLSIIDDDTEERDNDF